MKVLIVDDCDITIQLIMEILNSIPGIATYSANNGIECLSKVSTFKPDVIFLDINLGGEISAGIDVARAVSEISPRTQIIFVTGYPEFAVKAFQLEAVDYLVKPFTEGQVVMALNKVKRRLKNIPKKIPFKNGVSVVFIDPDEIIFIEKEGKKVLIHTEKDVIRTNDTLSNIQQHLNINNFYRTHQSYIVNVDKIKEITPAGNSSYYVHFSNTKKTALLVRAKYEDLCTILLGLTS